MAVAALVCGILAIVVCWLGPLGILGSLLGLLAIILGILGRKNLEHKNIASTAIIAGIVSLVAGIVISIVCVASVDVASKLPDFLKNIVEKLVSIG